MVKIYFAFSFSCSRNASIQLLPISCHSIYILNFLWNLLLAGSLLPGIVFLFNSPLQYTADDAALGVALHEKPLFALLIRFFVPYVYSFAFFANILYFFCLNWNNSTLLQLLDSLNPHIFTAKKASTQLFSAFLTFHHLFFLAGNWQLIVLHSGQWTWFHFIKSYCLTFILHINIHLSFLLVLYSKFATFHLLREMEDNFTTNANLPRLQRELLKLARLNGHLHRLLAFPLLTMSITFTAELIITFSEQLLSSEKKPNLFLLTIAILLLCICYLEKRTQAQLSRLADKFDCSRNCTVWSSSSSSPSFQLEGHSFGHLEFLTLYRPYFTLSIFKLFDINFAFLLVLSFFVLNYLVLLTQTST